MEARWDYVLREVADYWPHRSEPIRQLPLASPDWPETEPLPPQLILVQLPDWAVDVGVGGSLLVPAHRVACGEGEAWRRTDWLGSAFWYLTCQAELEHERRQGPAHSFSFRLKGWDASMWEHAWVNRIALFLRRWAANQEQTDEESLLGALPSPRLLLTHDVDAVRKTVAIRLKQSAFLGFQALRAVGSGRLIHGLGTGWRALAFLLRSGDYWRFPEILEAEREAGLRSRFFFYAGRGGWRRTPLQMLMDPGYRVAQPRLRELFSRLRADGWEVGLHPSYQSWRDAQRLSEERKTLVQASGGEVTTCRQHWLRFSWELTWRAQQEAGFLEDATLGFNDRPGFRCGAAVGFHPWDYRANGPMEIRALPLVLMDSHLYDYANNSREEREREIRRWVDEVRAVGGTATFLWHQRVVGPDYGWGEGFRFLLNLLAGR